MVVVFAKNQTMICIGTGPVTIFTDPVPLRNSDRLSAIANVKDLDTNSGMGVAQFVYTAQFSNDGGQTYVDSSTITASLGASGVTSTVGAANAALVRFRYELSNSGASGADVSSVCFDLHVDFEKA
jgi:hypothetical protein